MKFDFSNILPKKDTSPKKERYSQTSLFSSDEEKTREDFYGEIVDSFMMKGESCEAFQLTDISDAPEKSPLELGFRSDKNIPKNIAINQNTADRHGRT